MADLSKQKPAASAFNYCRRAPFRKLEKNCCASASFAIQSKSMSDRSRAEEDLRVIRDLMERATIYRAISAPTALVAGVLSILSTALVYLNNDVKLIFGRPVGPREFALIWIDVLILVLAANAFFIWREARYEGRPFISPGMKLAIRAVAPTLLIPAIFTIWFFKRGYLGGQELELVVVWVIFYGLALLSTALFAPRSLTLLGWAFLLTGIAIPVLINLLDELAGDVPTVVMGVAFGFYHLVYATCTWRQRTMTAPAEVSIE
jgi:hypothetical protein